MNTLYKSVRLVIEWLFTPITMLPAMLRTYRQLFDIFSGAWERRERGKIWCFSEQDIPFRGWYEKIAHDFATRGRFGYAWDNGAGDNLGSKIFNNFITYSLYGKLGTKIYNGFAILLFVFVLAYASLIQFGAFIAILTIFYFLPSPLVIVYMMRMGKPECLFWGISFAAILLLFFGKYTASGLLWSIIAFCNLPAAAMCVIFAGPVAIFYAAYNGYLLSFLIALAPGILKTIWRVMYMIKTGIFKKTIIEQKKMSIAYYKLKRSEIILFLPILISAVSTFFISRNIFIICIFWFLLMAYINNRFIKYEDDQSVSVYTFIASTAIILSTNVTIGYILLLYALYPPIQYFQAVFPPTMKKICHRIKLQNYRRLYPNLSPRVYHITSDIDSFFSAIPHFSRFVTEYDGDPRTTSPMRVFWSYLDMYCVSKKISLFNDIYLRFFAPNISSIFADRFKSSLMSHDEMYAHFQNLGINYVITYSDTMCARMESMGYPLISSVEPDYFNLLKGWDKHLLDKMHKQLYLFKTNITDGIVSGTKSFVVNDDKMSFYAKKGEKYIIRLLYSKYFFANQNGTNIPIYKYSDKLFNYEPFFLIISEQNSRVDLTHYAF